MAAFGAFPSRKARSLWAAQTQDCFALQEEQENDPARHLLTQHEP